MNAIEMLKQMEFIEDPGHGWLKVPKEIFLQEISAVSPFSYSNEKYIFLEEDCDVSNFLNPFLKKYSLEKKDVFDHVRETSTNEESFIRNLPHWCGSFGV